MQPQSRLKKVFLAALLSIAICPISATHWCAIVPNAASNDISIIDILSPHPSVKTIALPTKASLGKCVIVPDGSLAYIAYHGHPGGIIPYDLAKESFGRPIELVFGDKAGATPAFLALTLDGKHAFVGCRASHDIWRVDLVNQVVVEQIEEALAPSGTPMGIAVLPNSSKVYVTDGINNLFIIDTTSHEVSIIQSPTALISPTAIAIVPDGSLAFIVNQPHFGTHFVTPVFLPNHTLGSPISVDKGVVDIVVTADSQTAFVLSDKGTITPIDIPTLTAQASIFVGGNPTSIDVTPDDKNLYVAFSKGDSHNGVVTPIDRFTRLVGPPITVGIDPADIAFIPDQAPFAAFTLNVQPDRLVVDFDASRSYSSFGKIESYVWNFSDGSEVSSHSPFISVAFRTPGTRYATLTVTNSAGTSSTPVFSGQSIKRNGGLSAMTTQVFTLNSPSVFPPINFTGYQRNRYFHPRESYYFNVLQWADPLACEKPVHYEIYRDRGLTQLVGKVKANQPKVLIDRHLTRGTFNYYIVSIDGSGNQSTPINTVVSPL